MAVEKYYDDFGRLGVVLNTIYGCAWSTSSQYGIDIALDKRIVEAVLNGKGNDIVYMSEVLCECGYTDQYVGGLSHLEVAWVTTGTLFKIECYDGKEWIKEFDSSDWMIA